MDDLVSVADAAKSLALDPSRVRALVSAGALPGRKLAGRWLLEREAVAARRLESPPPGRPFEPRNAWALLLLASGDEVPSLEPAARWRLQLALRHQGLAGMRQRLGRRAEVGRLSVHPGELSHLLDDPALVRSGVSAAQSYGLDLVSGAEADVYVRQSDAESARRRHALSVSAPGAGNVVLRVVPDSAWRLAPDAGRAPVAAVALDLAEDSDPRSARAGRSLLKQLDREARQR